MNYLKWIGLLLLLVVTFAIFGCGKKTVEKTPPDPEEKRIASLAFLYGSSISLWKFSHESSEYVPIMEEAAAKIGLTLSPDPKTVIGYDEIKKVSDQYIDSAQSHLKQKQSFCLLAGVSEGEILVLLDANLTAIENNKREGLKDAFQSSFNSLRIKLVHTEYVPVDTICELIEIERLALAADTREKTGKVFNMMTTWQHKMIAEINQPTPD